MNDEGPMSPVPPPEGAAAWLRGLLNDKGFMAFVQEEPYRYRSADEYEGLPLPGEIDAELACAVVSFARRMRAMPLVSAEDEEGPHPYWVVSPAMYGTVCDLAVRSSPCSSLGMSLQRLGSRAELRRFAVRDLEAALKRDGMEVAPEVLDALVAGRVAPRDACERVVAAALALASDEGIALPDANGEDVWLRGLYDCLTAGADGLQDHPRRRIPAQEIIGVPRTGSYSPKDVCERIARLRRLEIHPLMDVVFVSDIMFDERPFERFNGLMEVVLRHVLLRLIGMSALRFVPYSALRLDWEMGINPQNSTVAYGQAAVVEPYGVDSTLALRESIEFFARGLRELGETVGLVEERDAERVATVEADWRLNPRQKELLREMIASPELTVDALGYGRRFDIAQSTAHTDLASLVHLGLLSDEFEGRKRVFRLGNAGLRR